MRILDKIIRAGDQRRSRFHTEDNRFIGIGSACIQTPKVLFQKTVNNFSGCRPAAPWWPLTAIKAVDNVLHRNMSVIEFGSGGSTRWLAERVGGVLSREHDPEWSAVTSARIKEENISNAEVQHRIGEAYYALEEDAKFDFAVVDGHYRWKCLESLRNRMKPDGFVYFDNSESDKDASLYSDFEVSGAHLAQKVIQDIETSGQLIQIREFHSMINGELFAGSGLLLKFH